MPLKRQGVSEGVQIRLDSALKQHVRRKLTQTEMTWQDLLEPCIRQFVAQHHTTTAGESPEGPLDPQPSLSTAVFLDVTALLSAGGSLELPLGSTTYRRWIHRCTRCQQCWVAELALPKKCVFCKSPYWTVPRLRKEDAQEHTAAVAKPSAAHACRQA